ncbi:alpha/beta hydrolase [Stieleria varia]|uniref:Alpha/beta-hydrolase family protein n=1 Tax=Stieleria varia TaxID=2528005 RepID=A0A5C6A013_9BACT|nr:alpha/beta-hydrolase family protein [Stieleria varia]TWT92746.1 hypothetical protein Pla52n_61110 [Stieleria varia]
MKKRVKEYWRSFSFVGLTIATVFFSISVTPSLLPRNYLFQGLLSGFSIAIGYALGVASVALYLFLELRQPSGRIQLISKRITVGVVAIVFVTFLWRMTYWQNSIRELMEMPLLETAYPYRTAAIALLWGALLVAAGRLFLAACRYVATKLQSFLPRRIALASGFALVAFLTFFLTNDLLAVGLLNVADSFFLNLDEHAEESETQPSRELQTGSTESLVAWQSIGRQGKSFLVDGPTREQISEFLGREAKDPIRVYVGMRSRSTPEERAELALQELIRVGGFDRSVLIIATPTGTGWLDPSAVDTVEYLHGGDTAMVSTQYSYLPSWITILVDPRRSIDSAVALFDEIYGHWKTLPKDSRPRLYLQGLSLGSLGSEMSADMYSIFEDPIDGALWSGPPFPSAHWRQAVRNRNEGTPIWMPEFRDGRMLRFTAQENHLDSGKAWGPMRSVYIQYASDPMVWFSPELAWSRPEWLGDERGPDVSPQLRWYPLVTFLQVAFDLPMATTVPIGYGHNYSPSSYIDGWISVTQPPQWDQNMTRRLKTMFAERTAPKP